MSIDIAKILRLQLPSPITEVVHPDFIRSNVSVVSKRDDLIHQHMSGNKWRKLKYNLSHYLSKEYEGIASFGGAHSNHLYALGFLCHKLHIPLIAIVRGDRYDPHNKTLSTLVDQGHTLIFLNRTEYRLKENSKDVQSLLLHYHNHYIIPEGGSNSHAVDGLVDLCSEINWPGIHHLFVSAGTGATAAGILGYIIHKDLNVQLHVVSALKGDFMTSEVLAHAGIKSDNRLNVYDQYHFGGYAKMPEQLIKFNLNFFHETNLPLDLVYNAKTMYGLVDLINNGTIPSNDKVLFLNTGGRRD